MTINTMHKVTMGVLSTIGAIWVVKEAFNIWEDLKERTNPVEGPEEVMKTEPVEKADEVEADVEPVEAYDTTVLPGVIDVRAMNPDAIDQDVARQMGDAVREKCIGDRDMIQRVHNDLLNASGAHVTNMGAFYNLVDSGDEFVIPTEDLEVIYRMFTISEKMIFQVNDVQDLLRRVANGWRIHSYGYYDSMKDFEERCLRAKRDNPMEYVHVMYRTNAWNYMFVEFYVGGAKVQPDAAPEGWIMPRKLEKISSIERLSCSEFLEKFHDFLVEECNMIGIGKFDERIVPVLYAGYLNAIYQTRSFGAKSSPFRYMEMDAKRIIEICNMDWTDSNLIQLAPYIGEMNWESLTQVLSSAHISRDYLKSEMHMVVRLDRKDCNYRLVNV